MMELGAMQCKPVNPQCEQCPLCQYCQAYKLNVVELLPVKQGKTAVRNRYFHYLYITDGQQLLLNKRGEKDIWQGLYEFPLIETKTSISTEELFELPQFKALIPGKFTLLETSSTKKHILSHQHIYGNCLVIRPHQWHTTLPYLYAQRTEFEQYPIPRLMEKLIALLQNRP